LVLSLRILFQFVLIKLGIIIFGHTRLVAQIAERFEPNTVLWAFHTIQPSSCTFIITQSQPHKNVHDKARFCFYIRYHLAA